MPMKHIRDVLAEKKELFAAYLTLHSQESEQTGKYTKLKSKRLSNVPNLGKEDDEVSIAENLARELGAAKKKAEKEDGK